MTTSEHISLSNEGTADMTQSRTVIFVPGAWLGDLLAGVPDMLVDYLCGLRGGREEVAGGGPG